jgi:hypothetical protein
MISTKYNKLIARKVNNNERLATSRESLNNREEPVQHHEQTRHTSTLGEKLREAEQMLPKKKVTFAKPVEPVKVESVKVEPVKGLVVGSGKSSDEVEKDYKKQVPKVGGGNMEMAKEEPPKRVLGGAKKTVKGAKLLTKVEVPVAKVEVPISENVGEMNKNSSSQGGSKSYSGLKWNDLIKAVCKDQKCAMKKAIAHIKSNNLYEKK